MKYADTSLTVDLGAIADNYNLLKNMVGSVEVPGIIKANAYGLGANEVVATLRKQGCAKFFVATLDEALNLSTTAKESVFVFHGIRKNQLDEFVENKFIPCLNTLDEIELWLKKAKKIEKKLPAIIHIDTGMNRTGVNLSDMEKISGLISGLDIKYIMSHLSCADIEDKNTSLQQLEKVRKIKKQFSNSKISLANSSGIFLGKDYHFDMVRPGISVYGGNPLPYTTKNPMKPAAYINADIIQIREIDSDGTVGYGASHRVKKGNKIAVISVGYADGYLRSLSGKGYCAIDGVRVPIVGRVSMDLVTLDVSGVPQDSLYIGQKVEVLGSNITIDEVANWGGTISYEILTGLSCRYKRIYKK